MSIVKKRKRIEVLQPIIKTIGGDITFKEILDFCSDKKFQPNLDCSYRFSIIEKKEDLWLGIVITNQIKDLPPKESIDKGVATGKFDSLGLNPNNETLAYPNIFLYDMKKNIFLYEVNKNGCFVDKFIDLAYDIWNEDNKERKFDLEFAPVLKTENYERVLNLDFIKRFQLIIANPKEISEKVQISNQSIAESILMERQIELSNAANAEKLRLELDANPKSIDRFGLNKGLIQGLLDVVRVYAKKGYKKNIEKIQVHGYEYSSENPRKMKPIDLFVDTFKEFISLQDIKLHKNIQQEERKVEIIRLHTRISPELKKILGV